MPAEPSIKALSLSQAEAACLATMLGDERLLTKAQAAVFLGVSPRTIDYYCAVARGLRRRNRTVHREEVEGRLKVPSSRQKLPHLKIGKSVKFQLGDLRRFRDERKVAA